jgi:hypothetical protein
MLTARLPGFTDAYLLVAANASDRDADGSASYFTRYTGSSPPIGFSLRRHAYHRRR